MLLQKIEGISGEFRMNTIFFVFIVSFICLSPDP